jgi:hypothetical protein
MQINPPFGYREIVPFLKTHQVAVPDAIAQAQAWKGYNAIPISVAEFGVALHEYPIVFSTGDDGQTFATAVVTGMTAEENLFVSDKGWAAGRYVPAYVRRYPFCMARVTLDAVAQDDRLICVEKHALSETGTRFFDDATPSKPLPAWAPMEKLLQEYEADLERTRELCALIADFALLEPFTMQATLNAGGTMNLTGMFRVSEAKLENLNGTQLKTLIKKGAMARIYNHIQSLENFGRLLDLKAARA